MFSMTPLFADKNMGGAQKQLKRVALHLGALGHDVTLLATRRADSDAPFDWAARVHIVPIFRFKQPFPEPYATPPYNIAAAIQDLGDWLDDADVFYLHDGGFMFPYAYAHIPTVVSFRSVIFSETLQSAFLFRGDELILISEHQAGVMQHTVGRFFPGYRERLHIIHNGLDWSIYQPTPPDAILQHIPVDANDDLVLYPHRPERPKGIQQTIEVVDQLVHRYGLNRVRALVPRWIDVDLADDVRAFYDGLQRDIDRRGLREHFVFHEWVPEDLLPQFYSMGRVTLCLGSYVETFGNVAYESLACGTPAVVARVGPNRDLLPEGLVDLVDYGDVDTAARLAADIIRQRKRTPNATLDYLRANFALEQMVSAYADLILNARSKPALAYQYQPLDDATVFRLAPWCYSAATGIYHDFLATYTDDPALQAAITAHPDGFTTAQSGTTQDQMMAWYREGYLVPVLPWANPPV